MGYADGSVFISWNRRTGLFGNYFEVVTCLRVLEGKVYASFVNGTILRFDLGEMRREQELYSFRDTVVGFRVEHLRHRGISLEVFTCNGNVQKLLIDEQGKCTFNQEGTVKNLVGACLTEKNNFLLSEDGVVLRNGSEAVSCEEREGWNCLSGSDEGLVAGSFRGGILVCRIEEVKREE